MVTCAWHRAQPLVGTLNDAEQLTRPYSRQLPTGSISIRISISMSIVARMSSSNGTAVYSANRRTNLKTQGTTSAQSRPWCWYSRAAIQQLNSCAKVSHRCYCPPIRTILQDTHDCAATRSLTAHQPALGQQQQDKVHGQCLNTCLPAGTVSAQGAGVSHGRRTLLLGPIFGIGSYCLASYQITAAAAVADQASSSIAAGTQPPLTMLASEPINSSQSPNTANSLLSRISTPGPLRSPGVGAPWDPKTLYYPRWLFGEWDVTARFVGFRTPLGPKYVKTGLLQAAQATAEEGGLGSEFQYKLRFYSTLPDTFSNQVWFGCCGCLCLAGNTMLGI